MMTMMAVMGVTPARRQGRRAEISVRGLGSATYIACDEPRSYLLNSRVRLRRREVIVNVRARAAAQVWKGCGFPLIKNIACNRFFQMLEIRRHL